MQDATDKELLRQYVHENSDGAFAALVARHVNMVYSAALRKTGNLTAAEEITQTVFILLAKKADGLRGESILSGWLYQTARATAANFLRTEIRRVHREQEAYMQSLLSETEPEIWRQIMPLLEDAMGRLGEKDRNVIALRFFEGKSFQEIGTAFGASENAAKKRAAHALEKLRKFFIKHGIASTTATLAVALSANSIQTAPAMLAKTTTAIALAKGATALVSTLALIKSALKATAWTKARIAMAIGASALLATGTAGVIVNSVNASPDDIINKLERQTGRKIVWDKHINFPVTFVVNDLSFEESLDQLAVEAGAYWSVDYAIYDSNRTLRQLLAALHDGVDLQSAGWTNLSSRPLKPQMQIIGYRQGGGMRMGTNAANDLVGMVVMLDREASAKQDQGFRQWFMQNRVAIQNGQGAAQPPNSELRTAIEQAMKDGEPDGALAPERLLADLQIVPKITSASPTPATAEVAEQIAKAAHASWTSIYTLRKSPVEGTGIKLIHHGMLTVYGTSTNSFSRPSPDTMLKKAKQTGTTLTSEEMAAHARAAQAAKQK